MLASLSSQVLACGLFLCSSTKETGSFKVRSESCENLWQTDRRVVYRLQHLSEWVSVNFKRILGVCGLDVKEAFDAASMSINCV